jgi:hypothetical protein
MELRLFSCKFVSISFFLSCWSEARYALRPELISTNTGVDRLTQITHLRNYYPDRELLTSAYWRPTITPYLPTYIPVQQRGAEGGRSDNQEEIGR